MTGYKAAPTWDQIRAAIPSKHLGPDPGFRRVLAEFAAAFTTDRPLRYLEVGTRLGHSLAMVLAARAQVAAVAIDAWIPEYAEESNGSPLKVADALSRLGLLHPSRRQQLDFRTGSSHDILPSMGPEVDRHGSVGSEFDLILIDGDHTAEGAAADLRDALPLLAPGGLLVFDDLTDGEGKPTWLLDVWHTWAYRLPTEYTITTTLDVPFGWGTARRTPFGA